jgi:hypothetical protein
MKARPVIAFVFLILFWVSVVGVEYEVVSRLGFLANVFVNVLPLSLLLGALLRAPEGYEDELGFHIGALTGAA